MPSRHISQPSACTNSNVRVYSEEKRSGDGRNGVLSLPFDRYNQEVL